MSALLIRHRSAYCGGRECELERRSEKGQRRGLGSVFIGGRALRRRRKGSGAEWALSM